MSILLKEPGFLMENKYIKKNLPSIEIIMIVLKKTMFNHFNLIDLKNSKTIILIQLQLLMSLKNNLKVIVLDYFFALEIIYRMNNMFKL